MVLVMVNRRQVMNFRVRAQQLDMDWRTLAGSHSDELHGTGPLGQTAVLDIGVQDTGPDGARWALAVRGVDVTALSDKELVLLWTVRGAPHLYRRADVGKIAAAVEPFSDADAGKRIYDASKPLKAAGIGNLAALDEVAAQMRIIVTKPTVKGDVSPAGWPRCCPSRIYGSAGRATSSTCTRCRSGWPPCGPGWNWSRTPRRRCCGGSPASPRRPPQATGSTSSGRTFACSARPRRSRSPATWTPR
jgi:DNA glycosylase AlkZ-like